MKKRSICTDSIVGGFKGIVCLLGLIFGHVGEFEDFLDFLRGGTRSCNTNASHRKCAPRYSRGRTCLIHTDRPFFAVVVVVV